MSETTEAPKPELPGLTAKQIMLLQTALDIRRTNSKELGAKLEKSDGAIDQMFQRIYRRWPVTNRDEAVDLAEKHGLIRRQDDND